jgi:hypothetical protein
MLKEDYMSGRNQLYPKNRKMQKYRTGDASRAQGARAVLMQEIAESRSSTVPFLNSSINFFTKN